MSFRETKALVNLDNLVFNYRKYKEDTRLEVFAVVKANAYGHGDIEVAKRLELEGVKVLCVSSLDEAIHLKEAGIKTDILIFSYVDPKYVELHNTPQFIFTIPSRYWFDKVNEIDQELRLHLKINTGMNRVGVKHLEDALHIIKNTHHKIEGLYTHFSSSDEDNTVLDRQLKVFENFIERLDYPFKWIHASNTHASNRAHSKHINAMRLGIGLYGYELNNHSLKQVLSLYTKVIHLETIQKGEAVGYNETYFATNEIKVATVPIGYGDGLDMRHKFVIINHRKYPIIGKVCMDQMMIQVDDSVKMGDLVSILSDEHTYKDILKESSIMPYLVMTVLSSRVPREYI